MAEVRSSTVTVAGLRSPLLAAGDPQARTAAVLVHGNPGSSQDWRGLVGALGQRHRAVALDMPGFGRADKPRDFDHSVPGYAAHLGAAMDTFGVDHAHLVLHDFGGPWGLAWAAANPGRVASVTLVNTGALQDYRWHWLARAWQTPRLGEALMGPVRPAVFRALLTHGHPGKPRPPHLPRDFLDRMASDFDADTRHAVLRLYRSAAGLNHRVPELVAALRTIDCPALVIWGGRDHYIGVEQALRQRAAFPRAEVLVLPGSGHWPMIDDAATVEKAVGDFVARV